MLDVILYANGLFVVAGEHLRWPTSKFDNKTQIFYGLAANDISYHFLSKKHAWGRTHSKVTAHSINDCEG